MNTSPDDLGRAIRAARAGQRTEARDLLLKVVEVDPRNEMAWIWLTGLVDQLEDKIIACENVMTLNPANERVRAYLNQLLEQQNPETAPHLSGESLPAPEIRPDPKPEEAREPEHPVESNPFYLAKQYEAENRLEEARLVYVDQASHTKDSYEFDRLYREITRIEALQAEKIVPISPAYAILRMTFCWPLLYTALALVQVGLNPLANKAWYLWLGLPIVTVGGFLLAASEVRSRHNFWKTVFDEQDAAGSDMARTSAAIGGWILIIMPHLLMLADALNRLAAFRIPPMPDL